MKKRILIIGGTNFIGRNIVESLLETNKYEVTLFNRGVTNPELFSDLKKLKGDRYSNDINFLRNDSWDFVIDMSCYYPKNLEELLKVLGNKVLKYIFISKGALCLQKSIKRSLPKQHMTLRWITLCMMAISRKRTPRLSLLLF